jgi:putative sterol carrier protein
VSKHQFLSDAWISESRNLREEFKSKINPPSTPPVKINLVVKEMPFGEGERNAHLDTTQGAPEIELGHLDSVDATVTVGYELAKSIFIDTNMATALEAMQLGRIKIDGDMMKLMALSAVSADPGSIELARAIRAITE